MNREDIIRMAREAGGYLAELPKRDAWLFIEDEYHLERFAALVASAEREACANICEEMRVYVGRDNAVIQSSAKDCAAAIRARGQA